MKVNTEAPHLSAEALLQKTVREGECLNWTGSLSHNGYAVVEIGSRARGTRRVVRVTRLLWELQHGAIPAKTLMCHTCDNKKCINPSHLYAGTYSDNLRDAMVRGLNDPGIFQRSKDRCANGHEYSGDNLVFKRKGNSLNRVCKTCRQANDRSAKALRREMRTSVPAPKRSSELLARMLPRITELDSGCREWSGAASTSGYPVMQRGRKGDGLIRVGRYLWEAARGPLADGQRLRRACANKRCVSVAHAYASGD